MDQKTQNSTPDRRWIKSAGAMGAGVFSSRILGLVREQSFAFFFGASHAMDAFTIAFRIPNLLRDLFAEGAMSSSFIPTFVKTQKVEGVERAHQVAARVFRVLFLSMVALSAVGAYFAETLVDQYAHAFRLIPGKFELTVHLTQILFAFFPFVVLAAAYMGILNAKGWFFIPAFASAIFNLTSVVCGVALSFVFQRMGHEPIVGMAWGVVLGGVAQAFFQLPWLYRSGYRAPNPPPSKAPWYRDPALRSMVFLILPGMLGLAATQINILVNSMLATGAEPGAVSWLNYAFRILFFPLGILGVTLGSVSLPRLSSAWADRDEVKLKSVLKQATRLSLAVNLPAAVGLFVASHAITALLFEYGRFTALDTQKTAAALSYFAISLPFYSLVKIGVPLVYAIGSPGIAVTASLATVISNLGLNLVLIRALGFEGLALGTSLTALVNVALLFYGVKRTLRKKGITIGVGIEGVVHFGKCLVASAGMGAICFVLNEWMTGAEFGAVIKGISNILWRCTQVGILVGVGSLVFFLLGSWLRIPEIREIQELFLKKLKRSRTS